MNKVALHLATLEKTHPDLSPGARKRMAEQIVDFLDTSIERGYDLTRATLHAKGAMRTPLGTWLQQLRENAGLTQQDVSRNSGWHNAKVTRIETGRVPITGPDLRYLLGLYGIRDPRIINNLISLARQDHADRIQQRRRAS